MSRAASSDDEVQGGPQGRVLGLDLGDARIGVSVSDPDRKLAVPSGTIQVGRPPGELKAIAALVAETEATLIVIGHPLSLGGESGPKARQVEAFAGSLGQLLDIPVVLHDERFSTTQAEKMLGAAGTRGAKRRRVVDATAATVILQSWIDSQSR